MNRRTLFRTALTVIALVCVWLAVRTLSRQWDALTTQPVAWHVDVAGLALALLAAAATYVVLIESWRRVLAGYDHALSPAVAARIWILSNFGKYLPGSLWIVAGMAVLSQEEGVRPTAAVTSAVIMQALALVSGVVAGAFAPGALAALPSWGPWVAGALVAASLAGLGLLLSPRALQLLQSLLPERAPTLEPIRGSALAIGLVGNLLAWLGYGLAIHWLAGGLFGMASIPVAAAAGAFAVAYLAGLLAVTVPAGLGVREVIFGALLAPYVGIREAIALAVASRLLMTLIELGLALPAALWRRRERTIPPPTSTP